MDLVKWLKNKNKDILTPQDALLTVALCAASVDAGADKDFVPQLAELARSHTLFSDEFDAVTQKIEALFPLIHSTDPEAAIGLAATSLTPELRKTAFEWAVKMALNNGSPSEANKMFLGKLVIQFMIDMEVAEKIYTEVAGTIYRQTIAL